ncbi:MAG: hypothetical protein AVDCRST_MAG29-738 [uncultured Nocardioidaceae bacterium]|uniref:Transmembrane protein n=1 Tax=uncultured Nocardioidaceae bacterium TaxID=253824 RepID=A0A6J4L9A3_9ACTN|nr:MAG: hypothetical protein AVDCRST_MAG29-738 [uncultured Nocardioidaceae bacterium]
MSHPVNPGNYSESGDYPPATSDPATGAGYTDAGYTEPASGYAEPVAGYSETAETGYGSSAYVAPSGGSYAAGSTSTSSSGISDVSVGEIMGKISADMSTLMRQELQLAKAELTVEAKKATAGVAMLAAAGVAGFFLLMFALITLWQALASLFDEDAWSALVVTVLLAVVAGVLALMGKKKMQQVNPKPEQTIETLQEAPSALKPSNR